MIIEVDKTGTVDALKKSVDTVLENDTVKGLLIFSCDANGFTPKSINGKLAEISILFLVVFSQKSLLARRSLRKELLLLDFNWNLMFRLFLM